MFLMKDIRPLRAIIANLTRRRIITRPFELVREEEAELAPRRKPQRLVLAEFMSEHHKLTPYRQMHPMTVEWYLRVVVFGAEGQVLADFDPPPLSQEELDPKPFIGEPLGFELSDVGLRGEACSVLLMSGDDLGGAFDRRLLYRRQRGLHTPLFPIRSMAASVANNPST